MDNAGYIFTEDVERRLLRRKPHWFHGPPEIHLEGEAREFGTLSFLFGDDLIEWGIWIRDREQILDVAHMAIQNIVNKSFR